MRESTTQQSLIGSSVPVVEDGRKSGMIHHRRTPGRKRCFILLLIAVFFFTLVTIWGPISQSTTTPHFNGFHYNHKFHKLFLKDNDLIPDGGETNNEDGEQSDGGSDNNIIQDSPQQIMEPTPDFVGVEEDIEDEIYKNVKPVWTYRCDTARRVCVREGLRQNETPVEPEVCWLTCGPAGALWPYPSKMVKLGRCLSKFAKSDLQLGKINVPVEEEVKSMLFEMWNIFISRLDKLKTSQKLAKLESTDKAASLNVNVHVQENPTKINLDTDESFTIRIITTPATLSANLTVQEDCSNSESAQVIVQINASTIFGARHALESLSQLIAFDKIQGCFQIVNNVTIKDRPAFPYRGILIDTARNFIPIPDLKRLIDGLSMNKLNILHWHLSDSNSWSLYSKRVPQMTLYGAYSQDKIYYPTQVRDLVRYARLRGVKIIPEIDAPAHAGNGWQWGPSMGLGDLAVCVNAEDWRNFCGQPPCGQLNPLNKNTYAVLEKLYRDFFEVFDDDLFHMGGDEVYSQCWETDVEIYKYIHMQWTKNYNYTYVDLWGKFQLKALERLKMANQNKPVKAIIWTGGLTAAPSGRDFLNASNYIIQVWDASPQLIEDLLREDYQLIMSNIGGSYLDQGAGTWLGMDHIYPYRLWQNIYDNQLAQFMRNFSMDLKKPRSQRQILGQEATLWGEKVNNQNMDAKTWPRGAALAENLWSNPLYRDSFVYSRLNHWNRRLLALGIHSDQLQPESCYLLSGSCDDIQGHI